MYKESNTIITQEHLNNQRYALLDESMIVVYIGNEHERLNSERGSVWIPIEDGKNIQIGYRYDIYKHRFNKVRGTLAQEKDKLQKAITNAYEVKMTTILSGYSQYEIATFPYQLVGLLDYNEGNINTIAMVFMRYLAIGREMNLDELMGRTDKKIQAFVKITGYVTGQRQKLEHMVYDVASVDDIETIEALLLKWQKEPIGG